MHRHENGLNNEQDSRNLDNFGLRRQRYQTSLDMSQQPASLITVSPPSTLTLDPPPPYVPPRAQSSIDLNSVAAGPANINSHRNLLSQRSAQRHNLNNINPSGTPVVLSAPSASGSATPKIVSASSSSLSVNSYVNAGGTNPNPSSVSSLKRTVVSADDLVWADLRRRQPSRRSYPGAADGYDDEDTDELRYGHGNASSDVNETIHRDSNEHMYAYTSSDNDYDPDSDYTTNNLRSISATLKNRMTVTETETETDEPTQNPRKISPLQPQYVSGAPSRSLLDLISGPSPISPLSPTSSDPPPTPPLLAKLSQSRFIPLLFGLFRLLSIVPAGLGFIWHLWCLVCSIRAFPGRGSDDTGSMFGEIGREFSFEFKMTIHTPFDHFVCVLWTLLTAYQCLSITTGLQLRWRAYYHSHATLIRLLALQAICWPATQFTLVLFNHDVRPVVCWALIGSTTCFSRAVQIWVVSNLKIVRHKRNEIVGASSSTTLNANTNDYWHRSRDPNRTIGTGAGTGTGTGTGIGTGREFGDNLDGDAITIRWTARRWDWPIVIRTCVLPAATVYFVMAWVGELRRAVVGQ